MKVVHYIKRIRLADGGVVRAALDTAAAIAAAGVETVLVTTDPADVPSLWKDGTLGVPRIVVLQAPVGPLRRLSAVAVRTVMQHAADADAVHLHALWNLSNTQLADAAHRAGIPTVLTVHGMLGDWSMSVSRLKKTAFLTLYGRALLGRAGVVHLTCQEELDQASKWFSNPCRAVIPLPIDLTDFRPKPDPDNLEPPTVLFLSRLHPVKGVDILLRAMAILRSRGIAFKLVVAGPGEKGYVASLRQLADKIGIASSTEFVGPVFGELKLRTYARADIFALPSEHENFGIVWAEAMACGVPAVVTRGVGPWKEIVSSGGASVAERSPEGIAEAIAPLLLDGSRRAEFSRNAHRWVREYLDPATVTPRYLAMYSRLKERPQPEAAEG